MVKRIRALDRLESVAHVGQRGATMTLIE